MIYFFVCEFRSFLERTCREFAHVLIERYNFGLYTPSKLKITSRQFGKETLSRNYAKSLVWEKNSRYSRTRLRLQYPITSQISNWTVGIWQKHVWRYFYNITQRSDKKNLNNFVHKVVHHFYGNFCLQYVLLWQYILRFIKERHIRHSERRGTE